mmetsp:Transcript_8874/g.15111  ORF Transcript_8874/g.15111 Transcript_8874/m.15111 type:complete len:84 (-) Transcript_8874:31-282(-)
MLLLLTLDVVRVFLRVIQPSTSSPVMSILIGDEGIIISTSAGGESGTVPLEDLPVMFEIFYCSSSLCYAVVITAVLCLLDIIM